MRSWDSQERFSLKPCWSSQKIFSFDRCFVVEDATMCSKVLQTIQVRVMACSWQGQSVHRFSRQALLGIQTIQAYRYTSKFVYILLSAWTSSKHNTMSTIFVHTVSLLNQFGAIWAFKHTLMSVDCDCTRRQTLNLNCNINIPVSCSFAEHRQENPSPSYPL